MFIKTHYPYLDHHTSCGLDVSDKMHVLRSNIEEVNCGRCLKIEVVYKSDYCNRTINKYIAKPNQTNNNNTHVNSSKLNPNATDRES